MSQTMTTNSAWDTARWRASHDQHYYNHAHATHRYDPPPITTNNQHPVVDSTWQAGGGKLIGHDEQRPTHKLPSLTDSYADASTFHSQSTERNAPPCDRINASSKLPGSQGSVSSWPGLLRNDNDTPPNNKHNASAPLSLQIPKDSDLPKISTMFRAPPISGEYVASSVNTTSQSSTTLPSFASFREHAPRNSNLHNVGRPAMPIQPTCDDCLKLQPVVNEVAAAVADLDESIRAVCNRSCSKPWDLPKDNTLHAVQWILDRLRCAKADLQGVSRANQPSSGGQATFSSLSGFGSHNISPSNPLKRQSEPWDHYDSPMQKRAQVGGSPGEAYRNNASSFHNRRDSSQFPSIEQVRHAGFSPPPSESATSSIYPKAPTPVLAGRDPRALPSPSSTTYPFSAATPLAARNALSPTASQSADASVRTTSADPATSAHMADLQHQVTLKSLALQTLQSEHASLMQRLQRLNVKTQAMERKGNVADQEVNDLTNKNEDLSQQVQSLQEQLDDSELRREKHREDTTREKDQWLQMLDQGRRLQRKMEHDNRALTQRIAAVQAECEDMQKNRELSRDRTGSSDEQHMAHQKPTQQSTSSDDIAALKADIALLRSALQQARHHRTQLDEHVQEFLQRSSDIGGVIDRALDGSQAANDSRELHPFPGSATRAPMTPRGRVGQDHLTTIPQVNASSSTNQVSNDSSMVSPGWKPQEHTPNPTQINCTQPSSAHSTSSPIESTSAKRPSIETSTLDGRPRPLSAAASLPTPVTPDLVESQNAIGWKEETSTISPPLASLSSTSMPPPPRPTV